ncbi:MAG TPA: mercury(II) reductase [Candidatus Caldiarchaeum subterraneum]|uniref:Mercuric reductase n=1 Tax=Caldiarchaeum subterraneum TaxID=311458 RepID=A0A832ZWP5_CALS0|nr:mercury(II) reductase [Candidatus Caldarchaeum subterraneum]
MLRVFDYVILGAGAAGFSAAVKLSELTGDKAGVALVNGGVLGGTCVNVGCIPSKYLIEAAKLYHGGRRRLGPVEVSTRVDFRFLMHSLREAVKTLRAEKYEKILQHYAGVEVINGRAEFTGPDTIKIEHGGDVLEVRAGKGILIATGSRPHPPPIPGLDRTSYLDSDKIWGLEEQPGSMLILGGGAIGVEIGQAMQRLGTEVTLVEVLDRILPAAEPEISSELLAALREEGMDVRIKTRVVEVWQGNGVKKARLMSNKGEEEITVDEVLIATGRRANTDSLHLEKAGVDVDERGFIKVDSMMRTSNPKIFAAGDVVAKNLMLETLSAREGVIAAINMTGGEAEMDYSVVPVVTFTEPQAASVGLTEAEAMQRYRACACRVIHVKDLAKAGITGEARGLAKLVIHPETKEILGFHTLSPHASEYILAAAEALRRRATVYDLLDMVHVFPAYSEALKLSAVAFLRPLSLMPCCME